MLLFFCFRRPLTRLGDEDSLSSSSGVWLNELLWLALLAELTMASEVTRVTEEHGGGGGGGTATGGPVAREPPAGGPAGEQPKPEPLGPVLGLPGPLGEPTTTAILGGTGGGGGDRITWCSASPVD